jgi:hypothetical protein
MAARAPERAVLSIDETKDRGKVLMHIFHSGTTASNLATDEI